MTKVLEKVFAGLMSRYQERVPQVKIVSQAMQDEELIESANDIENDHVAFRTIGVPQLGIASLEKIFLHYGYKREDAYNFEAKKLNAFWYSPPENHFPRIFISELRVQELSEATQRIIKNYTNSVAKDPVDDLDKNNAQEVDKFLHSSLWELPTWKDYSALLQESEYAAWTIYNRYYLNHFTISVHNLPAGYNTMESFVTFLEKNGIKLNDAGSKIKKSPDGLLLQSSTVAQVLESDFRSLNGSLEKHPIAGSYVEFAERKVLPEFSHLPAAEIRREHRRDGFEASNADKIFESTFRSLTDKADYVAP
jgi:hypothetical protein